MAEEIKYFTLNTGAKIPSVGLGTWQSEPGVVGDAIITAVKAGFRHIDCARIYRNEEEVGLALKKLFEDGTVMREDLFITSKIWCTDLAPEDVQGALDSTLNDLQLDYVDLYLMHWPFRVNKGENFSGESIVPIDIPSTWSEMEKLYDEGKARAIGVSNFTSKTLGNVLAVARVPPAVNQVECHPVWPQTKLRAFCEAHGVHLSGFSPLGSPGTSFVSGSVLENPIVKMVAEKLGKTPAQVALRWGLQMGNSVLPKSTKEARIKENLDVFDWSIPEDLFAKLSEIEHVIMDGRRHPAWEYGYSVEGDGHVHCRYCEHRVTDIHIFAEHLAGVGCDVRACDRVSGHVRHSFRTQLQERYGSRSTPMASSSTSRVPPPRAPGGA